MPQPSPLVIFNRELIKMLPRNRWFHCSGKRDLKVEPQYGSATKIFRSRISNPAYALVYFSAARIVIKNHGLHPHYLEEIRVATIACTDLPVKVL